MNSVSVGAGPQGEAVIFQRLNWKSCKSVFWLRLDGDFWITGLLLSKCGAGRQSSLLELNPELLDGINVSITMDGFMSVCWDIHLLFLGLLRWDFPLSVCHRFCFLFFCFFAFCKKVANHTFTVKICLVFKWKLWNLNTLFHSVSHCWGNQNAFFFFLVLSFIEYICIFIRDGVFSNATIDLN